MCYDAFVYDALVQPTTMLTKSASMFYLYIQNPAACRAGGFNAQRYLQLQSEGENFITMHFENELEAKAYLLKE